MQADDKRLTWGEFFRFLGCDVLYFEEEKINQQKLLLVLSPNHVLRFERPQLTRLLLC
jgi:hypothetical protein